MGRRQGAIPQLLEKVLRRPQGGVEQTQRIAFGKLLQALTQGAALAQGKEAQHPLTVGRLRLLPRREEALGDLVPLIHQGREGLETVA